ncbi:MAG: DNA gyrase subunit A [Chlamydiales bacterium]|nr:DNA gyrase subunit A [Chlamydiales bacterium]MCH9635851.1 DNA gyrase subunit A [Chlamydiales bacterium]MCH9703576.1 DNA topoisomerase (ATP-hydrolyzing) subunit A [Chlamydiota bacterium]
MSFNRENEIIINRNLEDEMKESYLRYSMSVIIARALPDVRDGLKPSQRRILFAMRQLNLSPGAKHRKCAKICGDTSGDYHPHGEQVIYPTLVRMAQDWAMRYPLVEGQGNFGSIDGDPPAAMRYTEARLRGSAIHLMEDLDKETVDMLPNYDETKMEPTVFPAKFPNLLCNGSTGIAVGMATNIPPHNLGELIAATQLVLDDPQVTIDEIMKVMPGPDFPTGGVICGTKGIHDAYHTGRGRIILRGKLRVEDHPDKVHCERIIVDEIPYNVNKSRLIEHIADLVNSKTMTGLSDVRDESDKDGLRIVLDVKKGEIADVVINQLYKFTDLQVTFGCNMLALDKNLPRTMNIKQMISAWVYHRIDVIRRRTRYELNKAEARAHILEGYLKAIDNLDEVVKIVRKSGNREVAKAQLIERFDLTDKQAHAVLDLRLYQLTGLEHDKIAEEHAKLLEKIAYFKKVLGSEELVRGIIKTELDEVLQKSKNCERGSEITLAEGDFNMEDLIADEPVIITFSEDDYVKRMPISLFREQKRGGQGVAGMDMRKEDTLKSIYMASTHDFLLCFTNFGRLYWLKVWQLPEGERRAKGKALINLLEDIQPGERIATVLRTKNFEGERYVLMATKNGTVKKTEIKAFSNQRRKGVRAVEIKEGDELIAARMIEGDQQAMLFTHMGMAVRFDHTEARPMGRTACGVRGVRLKSAEDHLIAAEVVSSEEQSVLIVCEKGFGKRSLVGEFRQTKRGGSGVKSIITSERNGNVIGAVTVADEDGCVMMSESGQTVRISMSDVRVMGRSTQGVKLVNLKSSDKLLGLVKLEAQDIEEEELEEAVEESQ